MIRCSRSVALLHTSDCVFIDKPFFDRMNCQGIPLTFHDNGLIEKIEKSFLIIFHYSTDTARYLSPLTQLRKDFPDKPIIITTESPGENLLKWSLRSGIWDCVVIPDELDYLRQQLTALKKSQDNKNNWIKNRIFSQFLDSRSSKTDDTGTSHNIIPTKRLAPAMEFIASNYHRKISVTELASYCNMSESNFSLRFKKETGKSIQSYITNIRINIAKELLRSTDLSLKQIASRTGFEDVCYFIRRFKTIVNTTPARYRQNFLYSCIKRDSHTVASSA